MRSTDRPSASARGSLRMKSALFSATGLFCYSEFSLSSGRSHYFVDAAQIKKVFYGISATVEGMALASYMAEIALELSPAPPEADAQLRLLLNCLYMLSERRYPCAQLKAIYELRALTLAGYMPDVLACADCGKYDGGDFYLDPVEGRLLCADCADKARHLPNLDNGALYALRHICLAEDKKLFGFTGTGDVQDTLLAGLLCALCFSGLFAMERKGGRDEILATTSLGRKYTVKAKLRQSTAVAAVISFGTVLPHLWQVLRDYGLPSLLGPAMSISDLQAVPKFITLSDLLIFWLICRFAACLCMSRITLWLGQKLGNLLTALFISAVAYCLPALLSLSGMKNGIEWLGFYPLFHAAALWQNQGYNANGESYNAMWIPIFLVCAAFFLAWAIGQALIDDYDMIGVPDEVL